MLGVEQEQVERALYSLSLENAVAIREIDNIKGVFPKYGDVKSLKLVNDRDELKRMLNESNDATERFKLNMSLIDFRRIPDDVTNKTLSVIDEKFKEKVEMIDFNLDNCLIF
jgi:hypothetical protein